MIEIDRCVEPHVWVILPEPQPSAVSRRKGRHPHPHPADSGSPQGRSPTHSRRGPESPSPPAPPAAERKRTTLRAKPVATGIIDCIADRAVEIRNGDIRQSEAGRFATECSGCQQNVLKEARASFAGQGEHRNNRIGPHAAETIRSYPSQGSLNRNHRQLFDPRRPRYGQDETATHARTLRQEIVQLVAMLCTGGRLNQDIDTQFFHALRRAWT